MAQATPTAGPSTEDPMENFFAKLPETAKKQLRHLTVNNQTIDPQPPEPIWEYDVRYLPYDHIIEAMNEAGLDRWEFCESYPDPTYVTKRYFIFKRSGFKQDLEK